MTGIMHVQSLFLCFANSRTFAFVFNKAVEKSVCGCMCTYLCRLVEQYQSLQDHIHFSIKNNNNSFQLQGSGCPEMSRT